MSKVTIELLDHDPKLHNFSCGETSIDSMVAGAYINHLIRKSMTFQIMFQEHILGYYQLTIENVYLNAEGSNLEYSDSGTGENKYGLLTINFLAIREEMQHRGIGTSVLRKILSEAIELSKKWPIRLVYIDAFSDKVDWYEKIGFERMYNWTPPEKFGLVPMFYELLTEEEKGRIEQYFNYYTE